MRIYNKKSFASGIFMAALATVNLIADVANKTVNLHGGILVGALYLLGIGAIMRSLSQTRAKQDKLEELDERNQLIEFKSKSMSFRVTQTISFLLMLALMVMGKVSGDEGFIAMGVGLAFAFTISMFAELFTYMYYEQKN